MTSSTGGIELRGVNHLALVCRDMERTVDFYTNVFGMPLVKTIDCRPGWVSTSSSTAAAATASPSSGSRTRPTACPASARRQNVPIKAT